jgi:hypothetical protein
MCGFLRDEIVAPCTASIVPRFSGSFYTGAAGAHHNPHDRRPCQTFEPFAPFEPSRPPGRVHAGTKGGLPQAAFILAPQAPTTTLTTEGRVKPLNPLHLLNPHARQGVSMQALKGGFSSMLLLLDWPLSRPPPIPLRGTSPRESVSRDFRVAIAPLQITFACHPYSGGRIKPLRLPATSCGTIALHP